VRVRGDKGIRLVPLALLGVVAQGDGKETKRSLPFPKKGGNGALDRLNFSRSLVASGKNAAGFDHQHDGALRCAGAMHNALGNDNALPGSKLEGAILEIDQ